MKQEIFTFPLWDAFQENTECPLCHVMKRAEESYISGLFRDMVNDVNFHRSLEHMSFCSIHFQQLLNYRDKFGLALIVDKILLHEMSKLQKFKRMMEIPYLSSKYPVLNVIKKIFNRHINHHTEESACFLCSHSRDTAHSYAGSIIQLWTCNSKFQSLYENCKGFCIGHFHLLIEEAQRLLSGPQLKKFCQSTFALQENNLKRLNDELNWFIKKFNYYYIDSPWHNSRDSLKRCIFKIKGDSINQE
ncbi:hypothetical protein JOD02_001091 [Caldicoprobacter guelmensis]|uniref:DUF6062 family protein n=1 Tax=Caldicoprobacter guelmensis TaxID=1170224 RepID=UPI00195A1DE7|nr:DUF6062 family protein [Caldicoprobacter guelmensis]MBM7582234.1 hypothetical protein [Caldicoprobacter guelmensis]